MSAKNALSHQGKKKSVAGEELSSADRRSAIESRDAGSVETDGSIWSHLLWGLATLALVTPLFIPGIPMNILIVVYLGLAGAVLLACVIWNFLDARPPRG